MSVTGNMAVEAYKVEAQEEIARIDRRNKELLDERDKRIAELEAVCKDWQSGRQLDLTCIAEAQEEIAALKKNLHMANEKVIELALSIADMVIEKRKSR